MAQAAFATARMLSACGSCHRAAGTMPAVPLRSHREVGGLVGHMQHHQQVADRLLQGLVVPSTTLWRSGAEGLAGAPLSPAALGMTGEAARDTAPVEAAIHGLAADAMAADEPLARASYYSRILTGCADCHRRVHARPGD